MAAALVRLRRQSKVLSMEERKDQRELLSSKLGRYLRTIRTRLPRGKKVEECFTESELWAIAAECGLSEEDLERSWREELKLNYKSGLPSASA